MLSKVWLLICECSLLTCVEIRFVASCSNFVALITPSLLNHATLPKLQQKFQCTRRRKPHFQGHAFKIFWETNLLCNYAKIHE